LRALRVRETVDGRARTFPVIEIGQSGRASQHQPADQQRDGTGTVDLTQFGGLRVIEYRVEWRPRAE
jgi:hypothetical protein